VFRNVAVFDFKSLYPSLMRTFNLDPLAHAVAGADALVAPNGARFSRTVAILPEVLTRFGERREHAKQRGDKHADLAIKIMMNAMIGVLGAPSGRFFDPEVANAVTGFGRLMLERTRLAFEAAGARPVRRHRLGVRAGGRGAGGRAGLHEAERLRAHVQDELSAQIRAEWKVEPRLELELEHVYERSLPAERARRNGGSKKRYAGLVRAAPGGRLEAVRRDWPELARRLQRGMLERVFSRRAGRAVRPRGGRGSPRGRLDRELVIRKALRKGAVERYTRRRRRTSWPRARRARRGPDRALRADARGARARRARRRATRRA
jgi:DNA polymerase-2